MRRKVNWISLYVGVAIDLGLLLGLKFLVLPDWLETLLQVIVVLVGGGACFLWLNNNRAGLSRESWADPLLWGSVADSSSMPDPELETEADTPTLVLVIHACDIPDSQVDVGLQARPTR